MSKCLVPEKNSDSNIFLDIDAKMLDNNHNNYTSWICLLHLLLRLSSICIEEVRAFYHVTTQIINK